MCTSSILGRIYATRNEESVMFFKLWRDLNTDTIIFYSLLLLRQFGQKDKSFVLKDLLD